MGILSIPGEDLLAAAADFGGKLLDRFFPDPAQKAAAAMELEKMKQNGELAQLAAETDLSKAQLAVNVEEAKSPNWFVAGWRPFVGWTCGAGLAYAAIIDPLLRFVATVVFHYVGDFPAVDTSVTMTILLGMLGMGGLRTYEKKAGVEDSR